MQGHLRQQYDIIFLDLGLPGMNGLGLAREIRKNPVYKDIPIIAATAFIGQEYNTDYFEAGFNDALFKPVTLEALQQCLDKYVRHYHETMHLNEDH